MLRNEKPGLLRDQTDEIGMRRRVRPAGRVMVRRAPHLVVYWLGRRLIFENYRARTRVAAAPMTIEVLEFFDDWREPGALAAHLPGYAPASLRGAVDELV